MAGTGSSPSAAALRVLSETAVTRCGGRLLRLRHRSRATGTAMTFGLFLPGSHRAAAADGSAVAPTTPALYWLSGLTCDDGNFSQKAGAFRAADAAGVAIVVPDTSPRTTKGEEGVEGVDVKDVEEYSLGQGAGFYVDATEEGWRDHYKMYSYVAEELPAIVAAEYNVGAGNAKSIFGHSMGGHGALTIAMKNPSSWVSVSAFAPICNPTECPWGEHAFRSYLGSVAAGREHDAALLLAARGPFPGYDDILVDQGLQDGFLAEGQLRPEALEAAAARVGQKVTVRRHPDHDHSYYFISSFVDEHVEFHATRLRKKLGA